MNALSLDEVTKYVDENIGSFHEAKLTRILELKLDTLLKRKNPYLFKAKNIGTSEQFVKSMLDAYLSSQEETLFGKFLEQLALFVCNITYNGHKSPGVGLDLDFSRDGVRYFVSIKSGPNWGNSQQISKMKDNFKTAKKIAGSQNIICVNGCCYGRDRNENKGDYIKKCGQSFWTFITDDPDFFKKIIDPLGHKAKERNEAFTDEYHKIINRFSKQFMENFCKMDGEIDWMKLVEFNCGINEMPVALHNSHNN